MQPEIPIRVLVIGSLITLIVLMMISELGFYLIALYIEDRISVNEVRKLYRLALYILMMITFILVVI